MLQRAVALPSRQPPCRPQQIGARLLPQSSDGGALCNEDDELCIHDAELCGTSQRSAVYASEPDAPIYSATPTILSHTMPKKGSSISVLLLYIGQFGITRTRSRIIGYPKCRVLKKLDKFWV
jgi:hypothetical protein